MGLYGVSGVSSYAKVRKFCCIAHHGLLLHLAAWAIPATDAPDEKTPAILG
jgi:hypothetical protein